jgi:hypothetical protein
VCFSHQADPVEQIIARQTQVMMQTVHNAIKESDALQRCLLPSDKPF